MLKQEQTIANLNLFNPGFFEIIDQEIKKNPDIVNVIDESSKNKTYLHKSAYGALVKHIAYLLEKGADIYLVDIEQLSPLYCAIGGTIFFKEKGQSEEVKNCYQIFKILLNYEAEQRAYFPEKYNTPWLKDQRSSANVTPKDILEKFHYPDKASVIKEYKKALEEAEKYYQKCLENKAKDIPMQPYHRQFLPEIIREENVVVEKEEVKWSDKISSQANIHQRRRSKSAAENASEPQTAMKLRSRSSEVGSFDEQKPLLSVDENVSKKESWTECFSRMVISVNSKNKNEKTL